MALFIFVLYRVYWLCKHVIKYGVFYFWTILVWQVNRDSAHTV